LLVRLGRTVRCGEPQLDNQVGFTRIADQLVIARRIQYRIKLVVDAIRAAAEGMRKEAQSAPALETKILFALWMAGGTGAAGVWAKTAVAERSAAAGESASD